MQLFSRIKILSLVLLAAFSLRGIQIITLDGNDCVFKQSGDPLLENALYLYHHYYQRTCDPKLIDFTLSPFFRGNSIIDEKSPTIANHFYGGFAQAVLNLGDLWIRTDAAFGKFNEKFHTKEYDQQKEQERSISGFDDITVRAGYDFFVNGDDHWGLYILGSIPVNHDVDGRLIATKASNADTLLTPNAPVTTPATADKKAETKTEIKHVPLVNIIDATKGLTLQIDTPQMGIGNYRVGGGFQGGWTLLDHNEHHLAFFADLQYTYAMSTPLAVATFKELSFVDENNNNITTTIKSLPALKNKTVVIVDPKDRAELRYTAGSLINILGIMHYACGDLNLELGGLISAGFGQKLQQTHRITTTEPSLYSDGQTSNKNNQKTKTEEKTDDISIKDGVAEFMLDDTSFAINNRPEIVQFKIAPYIAFSYNTLISDNPFTVGVGATYEFDRTSKKDTPNSFQGFTAWSTVALSF